MGQSSFDTTGTCTLELGAAFDQFDCVRQTGVDLGHYAVDCDERSRNRPTSASSGS